MIDRLRSMPGISCYEPRGAFYLFPNISLLFQQGVRGHSDSQLLRHGLLSPQTGACRGRPRRGFRRRGVHQALVRHLDGEHRQGHGPHLRRPWPSSSRCRDTKMISLSNTVTKQKDFVETEVHVGPELRDALVAEAETHLAKHKEYYEWNANILGVIIQLRTNLPHLVRFLAGELVSRPARDRSRTARRHLRCRLDPGTGGPRLLQLRNQDRRLLQVGLLRPTALARAGHGR